MTKRITITLTEDQWLMVIGVLDGASWSDDNLQTSAFKGRVASKINNQLLAKAKSV